MHFLDLSLNQRLRKSFIQNAVELAKSEIGCFLALSVKARQLPDASK